MITCYSGFSYYFCFKLYCPFPCDTIVTAIEKNETQTENTHVFKAVRQNFTDIGWIGVVLLFIAPLASALTILIIYRPLPLRHFLAVPFLLYARLYNSYIVREHRLCFNYYRSRILCFYSGK